MADRISGRSNNKSLPAGHGINRTAHEIYRSDQGKSPKNLEPLPMGSAVDPHSLNLPIGTMGATGTVSNTNLNQSEMSGSSPKSSKMHKLGKIISNYKDSDINKKYKQVRRAPTSGARSKRRII